MGDPGFVERGGGDKAKGLEASEFCEFLRHFFLAILAVFISIVDRKKVSPLTL